MEFIRVYDRWTPAYGDSTSIIIYDNRDPDWPNELWRKYLGSGGGAMGVYYDAFEVSAAELKDSLIYVVTSEYNVYDTPGGALDCQIACYDWVHDDSLSILSFHWERQDRDPSPYLLANGLAINGSNVAVGLGVNGFHIFDYSDPSEPHEVSSFPDAVDAVVSVNDLLLISVSDNSGNHSLRLASWEHPETSLDSILLDSSAHFYDFHRTEIASRDSLFFINETASIQIWKITDEERFVRCGVISPEYDPRNELGINEFSVSGDTIALGLDKRLEFWSITDPESPFLLGAFAHGRSYSGSGATIRGNWIYRSVHVQERYESWGMSLFHFGPVAVQDSDTPLPTGFTLLSPYPNPFNSSVVIPFDLPLPSFVGVSVYSMDGRLVESQTLGKMPPGRRRYVWDAVGQASGVYLIKVNSGEGTAEATVRLIR